MTTCAFSAATVLWPRQTTKTNGQRNRIMIRLYPSTQHPVNLPVIDAIITDLNLINICSRYFDVVTFQVSLSSPRREKDVLCSKPFRNLREIEIWEL